MFLVMISQSIYDTLKSIFTVAMASAFPDLFTPEAKLQPVQEKMAKFGDYMCVSTMDIAKLLKGKWLYKVVSQTYLLLFRIWY